ASVAGEPDAGVTPLRAPGRYLYDLDPGVGRASLVDAVAPVLHAWRLDEHTAYLSGDDPVDSPFARRFRIETWVPFAERRLREALVALGVTRVEVMRRASPVDTNALEARLNRTLASTPSSGEHRVRTVALTRLRGEHVAFVAERERGPR
ncbi:MAG: class I SAM-dependent methyltransferase, partial [Dehalococcoidia bacterium]